MRGVEQIDDSNFSFPSLAELRAIKDHNFLRNQSLSGVKCNYGLNTRYGGNECAFDFMLKNGKSSSLITGKDVFNTIEFGSPMKRIARIDL